MESGQIEGLRAFSIKEPEKANFVNILNIGPNLQYVLTQDPHNRMAYEYLMCDLLLSNNLSRFVENLPLASSFYKQMPRIFDEALLVYQLETTTPRDCSRAAIRRTVSNSMLSLHKLEI